MQTKNWNSEEQKKLVLQERKRKDRAFAKCKIEAKESIFALKKLKIEVKIEQLAKKFNFDVVKIMTIKEYLVKASELEQDHENNFTHIIEVKHKEEIPDVVGLNKIDFVQGSMFYKHREFITCNF